MNKEENELNYLSVKVNVYLLADVITLERTKEMDTFFFFLPPPTVFCNEAPFGFKARSRCNSL